MGAAKQRGLLALLLLSPNRVVGRDWLIDQLWDGDPPPAAKSTLQAYVYRLRKLLGGADSTVALHGRPGGYLLEVPSDSMDADRFERLVSEGRSALDAGRFDDAVTAFRAGLGLWRGAALADIDLQGVRDRARHLEDRRLEATEYCLGAELSAGRHDAAVIELEALVESHPLRERFWELLMAALYRCGRQAEALAAYQRLYRLLDEELGVQPAPPIQELQQQILAADPALSALPVVGGGPAATRTPRQLPATTSDFTGRSEHLAELDKLLRSSDGADLDRPGAVVITAIAGTAGVGKTTLAVHWAHQIADRFGDGQLYVNLRGFDPGGQPMEPAEAMRGFLDALNVAPERIPSELEAQFGLYRTLLADRRMLVVLDNARDTEQVRALLPGNRECLVVVTSRNDLSGLIAVNGAHPLVLDLLTMGEARQFLEHRLGQGRVAAEPEAASAIIESCARLPLALAIVATRAAMHPQFPLSALAAELHDAHNSLEALTGGDPSADVQAAFSWSYTQLAPEAARLFRLLGLHPGPDISAAAAASITGIPPGRIRSLLAELRRAHLLNEHQPGRYTSHDLLREHAADLTRRIDSDDDRRAAVHRMLDHYLHTAHSATMLLSPIRDSITLVGPREGAVALRFTENHQALSWFAVEHPVLIAVLHYAAGNGFETHACQLAWALFSHLGHQGHWHDWATTQQVALEAAKRLGDHAEQARARRGLSRALLVSARYDEAHEHLRQALVLFEHLDDLTGQAHTHHNIGWAFGRQGNFTDALRHSEEALRLHRATGHLPGQARALNAVGWYRAQLGDYKEALTHCRQALGLCHQLGQRTDEGTTWDSLGFAYQHLGDQKQAISSYQRALKVYQEVGERYFATMSLKRLAEVHHASGDIDNASKCYRHALEILEALDHPDAVGVRAELEELKRSTAEFTHHE